MALANSLYKKNEEIIINAKIPQTNETNNKEQFFEETPKEEVKNDELFNNIKDIFTNDKKIERKELYFTAAKGKFEYNIDNSVFMPSKLVLLQPRKFEEAYLKQLENYIYTNKENIDTDKLFPIIYLFSHLNKNNYPIRIVTSNYSKLLSKVCSILNNFFNKNYNVIHSMYVMFVPYCDQEKEITDEKTINNPRVYSES